MIRKSENQIIILLFLENDLLVALLAILNFNLEINNSLSF